MNQILMSLLRTDVELAVLSAAVLVVGMILSAILRDRLPIWRKGIWLAVLALPLAFVLCIALAPAASPHRSPERWVSGVLVSSEAPEAPARGLMITLATLYLMWVVGVVAFEVGATLKLRGLIRSAREVTDGRVVNMYGYLAKAVGCRHVPRLMYSDGIVTPFVAARAWHGLVIVLPSTLYHAIGDLGARTALSAILAHELAHARAGDPWLQRMLFLLKAFFPLAWIAALGAAQLCWEDAAEETGDLRAVRASGLTPQSYASVLKDFALAGDIVPNSASAGMGFGSGASLPAPAQQFARRLTRRLGILRLVTRWSERDAVIAGACLRASLCGLLLIFLTRHSALGAVVARQTAAPTVVASASGRPASVLPVEEPGNAPTTSPVKTADSADAAVAAQRAAILAKLPPGIRKRFPKSAPVVSTPTADAPHKPGKKH
jgi:beta-lactamase regulating signal transducer with metallopeptidase domain